MALEKDEIRSIVKKYGKTPTDTGSPAVQIAILTKRIQDLTLHLKSNKGDANARRSLLILVGQRHSLLSYLSRTDRSAYESLIASLGLRK